MHWQHLFVDSIQQCILGLWRAVGRERGPPSHRFYPVWGGRGGALPACRRHRLSEVCQVSGGRTLVCETLLWQFCFVFIRMMMCDGVSKKQRSSDTAIHDSAVCVCMCVRQDLISICLLLTKRFFFCL